MQSHTRRDLDAFLSLQSAVYGRGGARDLHAPLARVVSSPTAPAHQRSKGNTARALRVRLYQAEFLASRLRGDYRDARNALRSLHPLICARRQIRREVMHALGIAGKTGVGVNQVRRPWHSVIKC